MLGGSLELLSIPAILMLPSIGAKWGGAGYPPSTAGDHLERFKVWRLGLFGQDLDLLANPKP